MPAAPAAPAAQPDKSPAVRLYTFVCLLALLALLLVLLEANQNEWSLLPVALGCVTLLLRVRAGPPLVLLSLTWLLLAQGRGLDPVTWLLFLGRAVVSPEWTEAPFRCLSRLLELFPKRSSAGETSWPAPSNLILCAAAVVFTASFYRVQSLVYHLFPIDGRRKAWADRRTLEIQKLHGPLVEGPWPYAKRSAERVHLSELPYLLGTALACTLLAWLFWRLVAAVPPQLQFNLYLASLPSLARSGLEIWRGLLLFWIFGLALLLTAAVLAYLHQARAGPAASLLYLQDQLWQQTRREQNRLNRWLTAARLWWQKKKE